MFSGMGKTYAESIVGPIAENQKAVFQDIRNFLAGRVLGATRDPALLAEVMKCVFVRKRLLGNGGMASLETADDLTLARTYRDYFRDVRKTSPSVFGDKEEILLDPSALEFIHDRLGSVDLLSSDRDPIGDLFETFIGASIRGAEGQFFTPQNAGRWLVTAVAPQSGERIIDPACGAGGFLMWVAHHLAAQGDTRLYGIEKDEYLASLARARTAVLGIDATVYCANALSFESSGGRLDAQDLLESFDVVVTNPPFGKNINSVSPATQRTFDLGHVWRRSGAGRYERTNELSGKAPPQVLFMERVVSLLKPGGRAGVVVPESLVSSRTYAHVVQFLQDHCHLDAAVGMPENLFKSSGKGGTHTKTCLLVFEKRRSRQRRPDRKVFMAEAKWCGHDSRGRPIPRDDLPAIAEDFAAVAAGREPRIGHLVSSEKLANNILAPRYHEPTAQRATQHLAGSHELVAMEDLLEERAIEISTGNEVGKLAYGTGTVPFVRTSDISGWEIKIDPKHCVSDEIYEQLRHSQDVRRDDILMVRDGTYLIGSCAIITEYDQRIVYQSHIYKLRCLKPKRISAPLLLAILSSEPVQRQIRAKTFTQDIIDSLGNRIRELVLPIPRQASARSEIEKLVTKVIADRVEARELARKAKGLVVDPQFK